jgi:hypothetical protein
MPTKERWAKMSEEQRQEESERMKVWRSQNKDKTREYERQQRRFHPERTKLSVHKCSLKRNYGMTVEQYHEMQIKQDFCCGICGSKESGSKRCDKLFVDHDHDTGKIRGLLCHKCNMALGVFKNKQLLEKAISYLDKYEEMVVWTEKVGTT